MIVNHLTVHLDNSSAVTLVIKILQCMTCNVPKVTLLIFDYSIVTNVNNPKPVLVVRDFDIHTNVFQFAN